MKTICLLAAFALSVAAADYRTPAGLEKARRTEEGAGSVLPGGRSLSPFGKEYTTGPGPFGLAISPNGERIITADGGPERFTLTILEKSNGQWRTRELGVRPKVKPSERWPSREQAGAPEAKDAGDADDDWKSTFMGLAFDGEETLFASEGESGQVRVLDPVSGKRIRRYSLNTNGFDDSYSGDLALDAARGILYVVDQANFRVAVFDIRHNRSLTSVAVGRLPFAITLSPDQKRLYVTNIGMFTYKVLPGANAKRARETGLVFPAFGFPSKESLDGTVVKNASGDPVAVPGVGDPNVPESNSLCAINVENPARPQVIKFIRTGVPFGANSLGGSSPSGVIAVGKRIFVSNGTNDSVAVINADTLAVEKNIEIRIPGMERLRGVLPIGLGFVAERNQLLVAEAGINAVGVIDLASDTFLGHIPAGWFPTRIVTRGETVYVTNAKGHGIGPNATLDAPMAKSFLLEMRHGSLSQYQMPDSARLPELTRTVFQNDGFVPVADAQAIPAEIKHVVIIVKENRTFDEVLGDVAGAPKLARYGRKVTPNNHAIADRWAMSDNFYADSEMSVDGHHWLVGSYPNEWVESNFMANEKKYRLAPNSPGRLLVTEGSASVIPEDQLEAGTLWNHLDRHGVTFRNFGEGFEFPGIGEGTGQQYAERKATTVPISLCFRRSRYANGSGRSSRLRTVISAISQSRVPIAELNRHLQGWTSYFSIRVPF